ncbi:hypothetical protein [Thermomonospora catenispora]|uniref:hypothetical protein n=1 Tax=Thermomonospora catenispora TaxID=2493090 RepID=UPI00111E898A|nr:hypothetical protein [Thermomonospora catenispora]TNY37754.1 hypothetical protein EIO00_06210 [Thermomonospora catenispora]
MPQTNEPQGPAEIQLMGQVDVHLNAHRPTEPDEEEVLRQLYGDPDPDGFFRSAGEADEEATD